MRASYNTISVITLVLSLCSPAAFAQKLKDARKCGYCIASAEVLSQRVEKEKPRNHIDLRGRLDGDGIRYGKILDFRLSELRVIELLENLSRDLDEYVQLESSQQRVQWQHMNFITGNKTQVPEEEKQHWKRVLKRWCEQTIEENEDAITEYLQGDTLTADGIQEFLCHHLTGVCSAESLEKEELR